jgi:hypothetical protein
MRMLITKGIGCCVVDQKKEEKEKGKKNSFVRLREWQWKEGGMRATRRGMRERGRRRK